VRLLVDMGYTDRENLNPEKPVQFSLITPPGKVLEAAAGVPGALGQGATNLVTGAEALPGSIPSPLAATNSPSINAKSLPQEEQEPSSADTSKTEPQASTLSDPEPNLGE